MKTEKRNLKLKRNKLILFLLAIITVMSLFSNVYAMVDDTDDPMPVYTPDPTPNLKLASDGIISMEANTEQIFEIPIRNVSGFYAYNILVQASSEGDSIPYTMEFVDKSNIRYTLQNGTSMIVKLRIKADKNAKTGDYPIKLNYSYTAKDKDSFSSSDTIILKITNKSSSPTVVISDFSADKDTVNAGEVVEVNANVENIGDLDARDVKIDVSTLASDSISIYGGANSVYFNKFDSGYKNKFSFRFIAHQDMKTGAYPIKFDMTYKDTAGTEFTKSYEYYINVRDKDSTDNSSRADILVTNVTEPTGTYGVGQKFDVILAIKNAGQNKAKNIKITAVTGEDDAVVPRSANTTQIRELEIGEEKTLYFSFSPSFNSKSRNYAIGFNIEYETGVKNDDGTFEKFSFTQYVGANVTNPENDKDDDDKDDEDKKTSVPKIIVSKYESNPIIVEAGKKFDLDMTFQNTHKLKTVKNIKLYLTVDDETEKKGNVFSPDNSSNTFYIDELKPKGEISHTFHMYTVPDAQARTYTIKVNLEYEDEEFNPIEATELVGINVKQKSLLTTSDIAIPQTGYLNSPVDFYFDIYNMGKVTLSNLMIRIEGEGIDTAGSTVFIGDFDKGSTESYDGMFTPTQLGEIKGKVIISYEDTDGKELEKVTEFSMMVEDMPMDEMDMNAGMEEQKGSGLSKKVIIGGAVSAVVVIIVIITVIVVIKKKKQRGLDLDE